MCRSLPACACATAVPVSSTSPRPTIASRACSPTRTRSARPSTLSPMTSRSASSAPATVVSGESTLRPHHCLIPREISEKWLVCFSAGARLVEAGIASSDIRMMDKAGDVGGTWYWNRYPVSRFTPELARDFVSGVCRPLSERPRVISGRHVRRRGVRLVSPRRDPHRSSIIGTSLRDCSCGCSMPLCEEIGYVPTMKYAQQPEIYGKPTRSPPHLIFRGQPQQTACVVSALQADRGALWPLREGLLQRAGTRAHKHLSYRQLDRS